MEKFTFVVTSQELDVIYRSLLEVPAKFSLPVIQALEKQVREQESNVEVKNESNETTTE